MAVVPIDVFHVVVIVLFISVVVVKLFHVVVAVVLIIMIVLSFPIFFVMVIIVFLQVGEMGWGNYGGVVGNGDVLIFIFSFFC